MNSYELSRRDLLRNSGAALAGLHLLNRPESVRASPFSALAQLDDTVIPWLDQPPENPVPDVVANPRLNGSFTEVRYRVY